MRRSTIAAALLALLAVLGGSSATRADETVTTVVSPPSAPAPRPTFLQPIPPVEPNESVLVSAGPMADCTYRWDLNNDGAPELDTGTTPQASVSYPDVGDHPITANALCPEGTHQMQGAVRVRAKASRWFPGLSINRGATFTNSPDVTLSLSWGFGALDITLWNEGGQPQTQRLTAEEIPWRLDESGPEAVARVVHATVDSGTIAEDDIILDMRPPTVLSARLSTPARAADTRTTTRPRLVVKAYDATSGVSKVQVARNRNKPAPIAAFKTRTTISGAAPRWIRVADGAGNFSRWHRIRN